MVDVFKLGVPHADLSAFFVEHILAAAEVEAVGGERCAASHGHVLHARVVARAVGAELATVHGQPVDLLGGDLPALKGLRQRAAVIRAQDRQHRHPLADLQFGFREARLACHGQAPEVVGRASVTVDRQQLCAASAFAAVQLERVKPQRIHTKAYGALGKTGAGVEDEVLRPFLGVILRVGRVDEVAVDVEVA